MTRHLVFSVVIDCILISVVIIEEHCFHHRLRPIVFMHVDPFYLYAKKTVIRNIAACNTRLQAYNINW